MHNINVEFILTGREGKSFIIDALAVAHFAANQTCKRFGWKGGGVEWQYLIDPNNLSLDFLYEKVQEKYPNYQIEIKRNKVEEPAKPNLFVRIFNLVRNFWNGRFA